MHKAEMQFPLCLRFSSFIGKVIMNACRNQSEQAIFIGYLLFTISDCSPDKYVLSVANKNWLSASLSGIALQQSPTLKPLFF
jgi:hypothetical protein